MIVLEEIRTVLCGYIPVGHLRIDRPHASFSFRCLLLGRRTRCNSTVAAVIAHAVYRDIVDDRFVDVDIANHRGVHATDCGVVIKIISAPVAALVSGAIVSKTIVHAAVEANLRAPISGVPQVAAATPAPPSRSPQQTNRRGDDPCAWYPVIVITVPCPVTGGPDVVWPGAKRLIVYRKWWRCNVNCHSDAYLRK